jgi:hypothetical protein
VDAIHAPCCSIDASADLFGYDEDAGRWMLSMLFVAPLMQEISLVPLDIMAMLVAGRWMLYMLLGGLLQLSFLTPTCSPPPDRKHARRDKYTKRESTKQICLPPNPSLPLVNETQKDKAATNTALLILFHPVSI